MFKYSRPENICLHCQYRLNLLPRRRTIIASQRRQQNTSTRPPPPPPPPSGFAKLTNRRLISLYGQDASRFLQGLITANVPSFSHTTSLEEKQKSTGFYSAFLNAQGRVLQDVFIYPAAQSPFYRDSILGNSERGEERGQAFLIEVDANEVGILVKWLNKYKLRIKVRINALKEGEWNVWSQWEESTDPSSLPKSPSTQDEGSIGCLDVRAPGMGQRLILPAHQRPPTEDMGDMREVSLDQYTIRRMLHGVPEGQNEIPREVALPLDSCIDFMGGIDFRKGCYVGQELTIRTYHTGVVRKRILPVVLYGGDHKVDDERPPKLLRYDCEHAPTVLPPPRSDITRPVGYQPRSKGKFLAGIGNIGLALCRLDVMTNLGSAGSRKGGRDGEVDEFHIKWEDENDETSRGRIKVKAFVPEWYRGKGTMNEMRQQRG